ncbi:hypothetical protein FE257_010407 [Aspergillus nanangensis]|uniref:Uncharacterized protein n=1 Tax=Aspergillus nanangensis TaxID=2582783 RepID=A0AAD4GRB9_ASPNN|nr:hypothetical protein FE257_010407 [Aspergillus nanangensis]
MSFFFGRRHTLSGNSPEGDGLSPSRRERRSSLPNSRPQTPTSRGRIQDLFRRRREEDSPSGIRRNPTKASSSESSSPATSSRPSKNPQKPLQEKAEARKPVEKQAKSEQVAKHREKLRTNPSAKYQLTKEDAEILFSGAPYFLLEKGKHGHFYPQVIFPFDDHDPSIQNLWDRQRLPHPSFTICTLHAHLPVPDKWVVEGDAPVHLNRWKRTGAPKRATFDIGIFEVPNMLANNGRDPGTIGFRTYLEIPVGDAVRYVGPDIPRPMADYLRLSSMPAAEAYDLMEHYNDPYSLCEDGTVHDRKKLLCQGPAAWKRIGVRDINLETLVERLHWLSDLRQNILHGKVARTILDMESTRDLYSGLFTRFLYPPSHFMLVDVDDHHSLKVQIKALITVLATPGAWVDFSKPEWRLRIGQLLWETAPHVDGDFLDPSICQKPWMHPTLERKWALVQMLLAAELMLRLDATVRVGLLDNTNDLHISGRDMQEFDRLRNGQIDWCMVSARRFMDSFTASYRRDGSSQCATPPSGDTTPTSSTPSFLRGGGRPDKPHHRSFFEALTHRASSPSIKPAIVESAWNCHLVPVHAEVQMQGLTVFAETLNWPGAAALKAHLRSKFEAPNSAEILAEYFSTPTTCSDLPADFDGFAKDEMYTRSLTRRRVLLHDATADPDDPHKMGGWITRSWLSGFVIPGETVNHLLMATLLENDASALATLGPIANLYGGLAYQSRSWWSKECIVGRILCCLDGASECLGWVASPVVPRDWQSLDPLDNAWFEVPIVPPPIVPGKPRIKVGNRLSFDSTPLGLGDLTSGAFCLPVDQPLDKEALRVGISFDALTFAGKDTAPLEQAPRPRLTPHKTSMTFTVMSDTMVSPTTVSFSLAFNVRFVASHECRPPGGFMSCNNTSNNNNTTHSTSGASTPSSSSTTLRHHRLPGHPLHRSYGYKFVPIDALGGAHSQELFFGDIGVGRYEVMVVDARGSADKEAFARAWCASAGYDAIIGRTGRTCLGCCIREARAISVQVVLRVGDEGLSRSVSVQTL